MFSSDTKGIQVHQSNTAVGEIISVPLAVVVIPGQAMTIPLTIASPASSGRYSLSTRVVNSIANKLQTEPESIIVASGIEVIGMDAKFAALKVLAHDLPGALESGGTYTLKALVRNDSSNVWKKNGGRISAHLWKSLSGSLSISDIADASAELSADLDPGQSTLVNIQLHLSDVAGLYVPAWYPAESWNYNLMFDYTSDDSGADSATSEPEPIQIIDQDYGVRFTTDITPRELPGEKRIPVRIGVKNVGPQTWLKDKVRVGYHWYFLDGTEAIWQDETTPIPVDVAPGGEIQDMLAWITPPIMDGKYWLVWDVRVGDTWASTLPASRPYDTAIHSVQVIRGRLQFLDISKGFNLNAFATLSDTKPGSMDGFGRGLPTELAPPFINSELIPSTMWLPSVGTGLDSTRKISFRWGSKSDTDFNIIRCDGQRVIIGDIKKQEPCKALHMLATSTGKEIVAAFTLVFQDGTQQLTSVVVNPWDAPPGNGQEVGYYFRYTRTKTGDAPDKPVALYHYSFKVTDGKKIVAIIMPNAPDVKIAAITLEK